MLEKAVDESLSGKGAVSGFPTFPLFVGERDLVVFEFVDAVVALLAVTGATLFNVLVTITLGVGVALETTGVGVARLSLKALKLPTILSVLGSSMPSCADTVNDNTGKPFLKLIFPSAGILSGLISM